MIKTTSGLPVGTKVKVTVTGTIDISGNVNLKDHFTLYNNVLDAPGTVIEVLERPGIKPGDFFAAKNYGPGCFVGLATNNGYVVIRGSNVGAHTPYPVETLSADGYVRLSSEQVAEVIAEMGD